MKQFLDKNLDTIIILSVKFIFFEKMEDGVLKLAYLWAWICVFYKNNDYFSANQSIFWWFSRKLC